jgi:exopolysaccharide biosynthesis polyprenyl glycosylphosphotransferase
MGWERTQRIRLLIGVLLDAVLINGGIILAFLIRFGGRVPARNFAAYQSLWVFVTIIMLGAFYISGLYDRRKSYTMVNILDNTINGVTLGTLLLFVAVYAARTKVGRFPTMVLMISWLVNLMLISGWRIILVRFRRVAPRRVLVVGRGEGAESILQDIKRHPKLGYELVGVISEEDGESPDSGVKHFRSMRNIRRIVTTDKIDEVIISFPPESRKEMVDVMAQCQGMGVRFKIVPELYEMFLSETDGEDVNGLPLVEVMAPPIFGANAVIKRLIDILVSSVTLLLFLPLIILIIILIRMESRGPVLFEQERVGEDGRIFSLYKFRSMAKDAEKYTGPVMAKSDDKRITKLGRILRKTRLDEIPQLVNVLKGDMSLVGPRPERPFFVERFKREIPGYVQRLQVRPGVTGLAQVHSTYDISPRSKLRYDLLYVRKHSLFLDMEIILRTIWVVLRRKGAK